MEKISKLPMGSQYRYLLILLGCVMGTVFRNNRLSAQSATGNLHIDSLVSFAKKYTHSADSVASRGGRRVRVFAKAGKQGQYVPVIDSRWPDSMTMAVNVIYYRDKPVEYIEIPVNQEGDTYTEYDNYFYKGRIIGFRIERSIFKGNCVKENGNMNERTCWFYDSTGVEIKKEHTMVDAHNKPVVNKSCFTDTSSGYAIYRTFSDVPLVKEGKIPDFKQPGR